MTFAYSPTHPLSVHPSTHPPSFCLYTSVHPTVHHPSFRRSVPVAGAPELTEAQAQPPNTAAEPPHWPCAFPSLSSFPPAPSGAAGSTERMGEGGRGLPGEAAGRCRAPSHAGRSCRPRATPASTGLETDGPWLGFLGAGTFVLVILTSLRWGTRSPCSSDEERGRARGSSRGAGPRTGRSPSCPPLPLTRYPVRAPGPAEEPRQPRASTLRGVLSQ